MLRLFQINKNLMKLNSVKVVVVYKTKSSQHLIDVIERPEMTLR